MVIVIRVTQIFGYGNFEAVQGNNGSVYAQDKDSIFAV